MDLITVATDAKPVLDALASLVTIVGLPLAIVTFIGAKRKEALDREYGTYNSLDERYIDFVNLALTHIELDVFETPLPSPPVLTPSQQQQQLAAYTILMSIMERAYLMYADQPGVLRQRQWQGWDQFIRRYAKRPSFKSAWRANGEGFDATFSTYLESFI